MEIEASLSRFVSEELLDGMHEVQPEEPLLAEGLVDSLGMMRLVAFISERYSLEVPPEDVVLENFASIERMAVYLRERGVP